MFCTNCGADLIPEAKFCPKCGTPVIRKTEAVSLVKEENNIPQQNESEAVPAAPVISEESVPAEAQSANEAVTEPVPEETAEPRHEESETVPAAPVINEESVPAEEQSVNEAVTEPVPEETAEPRHEESETVSAAPVINEVSVPAEEQSVYEAASPVLTEQKKPEKVKKPKAESAAGGKKFSIVPYVIMSFVYMIVTVIPVILGIYLLPDVIMPAVMRGTAEAKAMEKDYGTAEMLYQYVGDESGLRKTEYKHAEKLMDDGDCGGALALLVSLDNAGFDDEDGLMKRAAAERCNELLGRGAYAYALADSYMISDPKKKSEILNGVYVERAYKYTNEGNCEEAYYIVRDIDKSGKYDAEKYKAVVYNYAVTLYNKGEFEEACDVMEDVLGYAESNDIYKAAAYNAAEDLCGMSDYEKAMEYYEKSDGYSGSEEGLRKCNYMLGIKCFDAGRYDEAKKYFTEADGYDSSASYIKKCDERMKYSGWYVKDAFLCSSYYTFNNLYIPTEEKSSFSKYDDFGIIVRLTNSDESRTDSVDVNVTITSPGGTTSTETVNMDVGGNAFVYFSYDYPDFGATGYARFTVSLKDTGDVLETYYFSITD